MTQSNWPNPMPPPLPNDGNFPPPKKGMSGGAIAAIVIAVIVVLGVLAGLIAIPVRNRMLEQAQRAKSLSNLLQIGTACVEYSRDHEGRFPDSMSEMLKGGYATPSIHIDPGSSDTASFLPASMVTEADLAGHCSYVYVGQGLREGAIRSQTVLAYESLSSHKRKLIGVVYADRHVEVLSRPAAERMILMLPHSQPPVASPH